jgi:dienelactone hydrolase
MFILLLITTLFGDLRLNSVPEDQVVAFPNDTLPVAEPLPGTKPLEWNLSPQEVSRKMLDGAHAFIDEKIRRARDGRGRLWKRDFSSRTAYERSVDPNRKRLMDILGIRDKSGGVPAYHPLSNVAMPASMEKLSPAGNSDMVAETDKYQVYQIRWPALDGVYGQGLLVQPNDNALGNIITIPDADQTPEQLMGLSPGVPAESQFARRMAENGYQVLIPALISRTIMFPDQPKEQTHREWIYRQAFHMGKHLIGYEVEKIIAAVDWLKSSSPALKTGVAGYNEGGLIAMYAAAIDTRIDAVMVSGYFSSREKVWEEPIYRNVWSLLAEFGDAEIVSLIAPRPVVIEYSAVDEKLIAATRRPSPINEYSYSGYKGSIRTADYREVESEFRGIDALVKSGFQKRELITGKRNQPVPFGSASAMDAFARSLGNKNTLALSSGIPVDKRPDFSPAPRELTQVREIEDHVQRLLRDSDAERYQFYLYKVLPAFGNRIWSTKSYHPYFSPDTFITESKKYRKYFSEEIIGRFDDTFLPANARTRKVYDEKLWTGYEVVLDVYKDLIAPGILLLPKDMEPGEKRPVVVCQHGRNGVPQMLVEGNTSYYDMASKLADQGFIIYAPYGIFSGEDRYRWLSRKANTVKKSMFSFVVAQHDQMLRWLGSLPFVDKNRIAFYGKSYGGETAMRVPSILEGYCLSICSADFGDWTRKVVDTHFSNSFMYTNEWEMPYFRMGSTFSYAEMAYLIFPRPFMVERGRHDLVQPDEFVGSEYAKVSFLYDQFNMLDKTQIQFFNGGHASRNDATFDFLHKHLNWP